MALRLRQPFSLGRRGAGGNTLARAGEKVSGDAKEIFAQQTALLRFFHGDVWLSEDEVEYLGTHAEGKQSSWARAWEACDKWRRPGGVRKWQLTPLGRVMGDGEGGAQLMREDLLQASAAGLAAAAGGATRAADLLAWLQDCLGAGRAAAPRGEVLGCVDLGECWAALVDQQCDGGRVELRALAEEAASRLGGRAAGGHILRTTGTRQLMGGSDFIGAMRRQPTAPILEEADGAEA